MITHTAFDPDLTRSLHAIIELTRSALPDASSLCRIALASQDLEIAHDMLRRVYELALEADLGYVASLVDGALARIEDIHTRPAAIRG